MTGEEFAVYIRRKRQDGVHGNNPEIQAISELFNRPIEVFSPENGSTPLNIFHAEYKTDDAPIRLSYHDGNHYNAVIDPLVPTAGLGLGLPGLQPGLADKLQVAKAVAESDAAADQLEYERALKESEEDELQRALKDSQLSTEHVSLCTFRFDWRSRKYRTSQMYRLSVLHNALCRGSNFHRVEAMRPWPHPM